MQEYRQCPCGQTVAMDLTVRQCPACGRPVDRTWRVVYPERSAPASPAAAEVRQPLQQPLQQPQLPLHFFFLGRNSSHAMYPPMAASSA